MYNCPKCEKIHARVASAANCCGVVHPLELWRLEHGVSKSVVAEMLGVARANIYRWIKCENLPWIHSGIMDRITRLTGITYEDMVEAYNLYHGRKPAPRPRM